MNLHLEEIFEIDELKSICESFTELTGAVTAILDLEGKIHVATGWQPICTKFHRANSETCKLCIESDTILAGKVEKNRQYTMYKCRNGLMDVAMPIIIKDHHLGNFFTGQFFTEKPDNEYFRQQAIKYDFDQEKYMEALEQVPILSEDKVRSTIQFLVKLTETIGKIGLKNLENIENNKLLKRENQRINKINADLKLAQTAFKESEEKFRNIAEQANEMIFVTDNKGKIEFLSQASQSIFGYKPEEMTGHSFMQYLKKSEIPKAMAAFLKTLGQGIQTLNLELLMKHKDGSYFEGLLTGRMFKTGKLKGTIGVIRDISEHKRSKEELIKKENKYQTILKTAINGFWIVDSNGKFIEVNEAYCQMSGFSRKELLTMSIDDIEAIESVSDIKNHLNKIVKNRTDRFESKHIKKDKSTFDVEIKVQHQSFDEEQFIVFIEDISERKKIEQDLLLNQYYLSKAQEIGKIGTWELDMVNNKLIWTDQNYRNFGIKPGTPLTYEIFLDCVHPHDREYVNTEWMEATKGKPYDIEHRLIINGETRWVREKADLTFDKNGKAISAIGFTQDITNYKEVHEKLLISLNREKFHADIVRNTPIAIAFGYPDGRLEECNTAFIKLTGYSEEELKKINWNSDLTPGKWNKLEAEKLKTLTPQNNSIRYEKEYIHKNGTIIPIELTVSGKYDKNRLIHYIAFITDITERKEAVKKIRMREANLSSLLENPAGYLIYRTRFNIETQQIEVVQVSPSFTEVLGITEAEKMDFQKWFTNVYPDDLQTIMAASEKGMQPPFKLEAEIRYKHPTKGIIWLEVRASGVPYENNPGIIEYANGIIIDITDRKNAETALRTSEEMLRNIFDNSTSVIYSHKVNNIVNYVSPQIENILGYTQEEALVNWTNLLTDNPINENARIYTEKAIITGEKQPPYELELRHKNGNKVLIEAREAPVIKEGKTISIVGIFNDITERKQSEEKLLNLTRRLELSTKSAKLGIWDLDLENNILNWDKRMFEIYGIDEQNFGGAYETWKKGVHPDDIERSDAEVKAAIAGEKEFKTQFRIIWPNGEIRYIEAYAIVTRNEANEPNRMIGVNWDITERIAAERRTKRFSRIFEDSLNEIYLFDVSTLKFIQANEAALKNLNYTMEELLEMTPIDVKSEYFESEFIEKLQPLLTGEKEELVFETIHQRRNKSTYDVEVHLQLLDLIEEKVFVAIVIDITERKQILKTLQERNRYIESIMDNMPIGFAVNTIDDGDVKYMNSLFEEIYGWPKEELTNTSLFFEKVFQDKDFREKMKARIIADMQSGDPERMQWKDLPIVTSKGETRFVYAFNIPLFEQNLMISTVQDVTQQKLDEEALIKAKEKAEESDQLKSAFLANMSHEIRTPMNGILGFTELLKTPELTGEQHDRFLEIIRKSGNRMLSTVNDIIDISKIDAGQVEVNRSAFNMIEEIESQFEFFKVEAAEKELELKYSNSITRSANFITDRVKFNSIVSNLIKNAIKYTDQGSIQITCSKTEEAFRFEIKDTGIGIPADRITSIFNRFEQADISDSNARQGSGLGLAITKSYIDMMGGSIGVTSEIGVGSTFYFTLPWREQEPENDVTLKETETRKTDLNKLNILIAEDDDISFEHLKIILTPVTKEIIRVFNGREAVEAVRSRDDMDLVLMDINMPILSGYEATKEIRKFNKEIKIIAQTAYALAGDKEKTLAAGCDDYISKPINREYLIELIKRYVVGGA